MKILHINTHETRGGAAQAMQRILQGQRAIGLDPILLVGEREADTPNVIVHGGGVWRRIRWWLDSLPYRWRYPNRRGDLALQWLPDRIASQVTRVKPDLIHLHWFYGGFMRLETLAQFGVPLVWTLHDEWAFTGGCFYTRDCERFRACCGACPDLYSTNEHDLTRRVWERKSGVYPKLKIQAATYSSAMVDKARASSLFRDVPTRLILNAIDTDFYTPGDTAESRAALGLPTEKRVLLWAAYDISTPVKGFAVFSEALGKLPAALRANLILVALGQRNGMDAPAGIETRFPSLVRDPEWMRHYYRAADSFISSSSHEVGPQTVMEAMACATPCVGFGVGGHLDRIDHQQDGCLATPGDPADLAAQIEWLLSDPPRHAALGTTAREQACEKFALRTQAQAYEKMYREMIG